MPSAPQKRHGGDDPGGQAGPSSAVDTSTEPGLAAGKRQRGALSQHGPGEQAAPSSAMPLTAAEYEACRRTPLSPSLRQVLADNGSVLLSWRDDMYTEDRAHDELVTALGTESTRNRIQSVLIGLASWGVTAQIPSRSAQSGTLRQDLQQIFQRMESPQRNFRATLELARLMHALALNDSCAEVLRRLIAFVNAQLPQPAVREAVPDDNDIKDQINFLYAGWNTEYYGCALAGLQETLRNYESEYRLGKLKDIYAKTLNIIQSSGTGKSRLMAALARKETSVCFTFRSNGETGYPPGDPEIRNFLLFPEAEDRTELHTRALSLLAGVFHVLAENVNSQPSAWSSARVADDLADRMAPVEVHKPLPIEPNCSDIFSHSRSAYKRNFCSRVINWAETEATRLRKDKSWTSHWSPDGRSDSDGQPPDKLLGDQPEKQRRKPLALRLDQLPAIIHLSATAKALCDRLRSRSSSDQATLPLVVLVFDEARQLVNRQCVQGDMYSAVCRILGTIQHLRVWTFFLSTNASVVTLGRPRREDPSKRVIDFNLSRLKTYHALPIDLGMAEQLQTQQRDGTDDITLTPLAEVGTAAFMTLYGRPLWRIYGSWPLDKLRRFARVKLFCDPTDKGCYDPTKDGHVFAALAARVSLDPCMIPAAPSPEAVGARTHAMKTAVDMHLRFVTNIDGETGLVTTTTPSEPVVSDAVAEEFSVEPERLWIGSIEGLTRIMGRGIIDKGAKGELWARVLFIMAIDMLRRENRITRAESTDDAEKDKPFEPVRLLEFLKHLLAPEAYNTLVGMQAQHATRRNPPRAHKTAGLNTKAGLDTKTELAEAAAAEDDSDVEMTEAAKDEDKDEQRNDAGTDTTPQTVGEAFTNAFIHFSRFVATDVHVKDGEVPELLHLLLLEQAALQGAHGQPLWDLLIPIYMGDPSKPFNRARVTALIVQIKNRGQKMGSADPLLKRRDLAKMFGNVFSEPVLFLVLELGIEPGDEPRKAGDTEKVDEVCARSPSFAPHVFQARLRGAAKHTYALLSGNETLASTLSHLLKDITTIPPPVTIAERICYGTTAWRRRTFEKRFSHQQRQ